MRLNPSNDVSVSAKKTGAFHHTEMKLTLSLLEFVSRLQGNEICTCITGLAHSQHSCLLGRIKPHIDAAGMYG